MTLDVLLPLNSCDSGPMDVSRDADGSRTIPGLGGTGCLPKTIRVVPSSCVTVANSLLYAPSLESWVVFGIHSLSIAS